MGRRKGGGADPEIPEQMYYLVESNDNNVTSPKVYRSAWRRKLLFLTMWINSCSSHNLLTCT